MEYADLLLILLREGSMRQIYEGLFMVEGEV